MIWAAWWAWAIAALVLGLIETLLPLQIMLGFAVGAGVNALILGFGISLSLGSLLAVFAITSLIAWIVLRRVLGVRPGQVKIWDTDIND